jgi:hypothetical protein
VRFLFLKNIHPKRISKTIPEKSLKYSIIEFNENPNDLNLWVVIFLDSVGNATNSLVKREPFKP